MTKSGWSDAITYPPPFLDKKKNLRTARLERKERLVRAIKIINPGGPYFWIGRAIWLAASEYNGYRALSEGAPRRSTIQRQLAEVEKTCRAAARAIDALSDPALNLWHTGSVAGEGWAHMHRPQRHRELYDRALGGGFPEYAGYAYPDLDDPNDGAGSEYPGGSLVFLVPRLRMTADLASELNKALSEQWGKDRGGGQDFFQQSFGSVGWHLVLACYFVFREYSGKPTGTEGGPFYQFVVAVHEFATGLEGEDSLRGVRDRVRDAVSICGEFERMRDKMPKRFGDPGAIATEEEAERFRELSQIFVTGIDPRRSRS